MFSNFYNAIVDGFTLPYLAAKVIVLLLLGLAFVFVRSSLIVSISLLTIGMMNIADNPEILGNPPWGIILVIYGLNMINVLWVNLASYTLTLILVVVSYTANGQPPTASLNIILAYIFVFFINHTLFFGRGFNGDGNK